jgi:hypothetical protein
MPASQRLRGLVADHAFQRPRVQADVADLRVADVFAEQRQLFLLRRKAVLPEVREVQHLARFQRGDPGRIAVADVGHVDLDDLLFHVSYS